MAPSKITGMRPCSGVATSAVGASVWRAAGRRSAERALVGGEDLDGRSPGADERMCGTGEDECSLGPGYFQLYGSSQASRTFCGKCVGSFYASRREIEGQESGMYTPADGQHGQLDNALVCCCNPQVQNSLPGGSYESVKSVMAMQRKSSYSHSGLFPRLFHCRIIH